MKGNKHPTFNIERPTSKEGDGRTRTLHDGGGDGRNFDWEERLLEFASAVIDLSEKPPDTRAGNHVAGQILRSGTSPHPNHGEAEAAESRNALAEKRKSSKFTRYPSGAAG